MPHLAHLCFSVLAVSHIKNIFVVLCVVFQEQSKGQPYILKVTVQIPPKNTNSNMNLKISVAVYQDVIGFQRGVGNLEKFLNQFRNV